MCVPFLHPFPGNEAHKLLPGVPKMGVLGGGQKVYVEKVDVLFRSPILAEKPRIRLGCPSRSTFSQAPRKLRLVDFGRKEYGYQTSWRAFLTILQEPALTVLLVLPNIRLNGFSSAIIGNGQSTESNIKLNPALEGLENSPWVMVAGSRKDASLQIFIRGGQTCNN